MCPRNVLPSKWDKALVYANIALVSVTLFYVIITGCILYQTTKQTNIIRNGYVESLKPFLLPEIDSLSFTPIKRNKKSSLDISFLIRIKNEGQSHAKINFFGVDLLPLNKDMFNVRDSLKAFSKHNVFQKSSTNLSEYIPSHNSIYYIRAIQNIGNKISDDKTYLHIMIIYRDAFGNYHDTYSIYKIFIDTKTYRSHYYPPIYDFHDYTENEIKKIYKNVQ